MAQGILKIVAGQTAGRQIALDSEFVVGRAESGLGNLGSDTEISRRHARFYPLNTGEILVEDLGSTNGTLVNGQRITAPHVLRPGDQIKLGMTTLQFEGPVQPQPAVQQPPAAPAAVAPAPVAAAPATPGPLPNLGTGRQAATTRAEKTGGRGIMYALAALLVIAIAVGVIAIVKKDGKSTTTATAASSSAPAGDATGHPSTAGFKCSPDKNGSPGPGHFRFITSGCEDARSLIAQFPLQQGTSGGKTVWYVVTDSSNKQDALARHVNFAQKLANGAGTPGVQNVTMKNGMIDFPATVNFAPKRELQPGPNGFPPAKASPPSVGNSGYSPLIRLPSGIVINAPQIANDTGQADKALKIDKAKKTVLYQETEGRYEDKHVHYVSFESGDPGAATIEDVTFAPGLNKLPKPGLDGFHNSAREELVAFIDGPTGIANPGRQGINSTILDDADPHNILKEVPVLPLHSDIGDPHYTPGWDVHFAEWTPKAIASGARVEVQSTDEVDLRVKLKLVTAPGGKPFGASNVAVNCPLVSIDVP